MKLGKRKKNTPGCLTNKAMAYIKNKPAMYGKPKMAKEDPFKKQIHKDQFGYLHKESDKQRNSRLKAAYNKKFGDGAWQRRTSTS